MTRLDIIAFNQKNIETGLSDKGYDQTYFARRNFKRGEEVMRGWGRFIDHQTSHMSVQVGSKKHYLPEKWTGRYWNHSCNPNTYIKTRTDGFPSLYASRNIKKGEEITYHYSMTEYQWVKGAKENYVKCLCREKNCQKKILSFSQLSPKEQSLLLRKASCSNYLLNDKISM